MSSSGQLFPRKWNITVANAGAGLDLSELHIKFKVNQSDVETPNNCSVRIYNLSAETSSRLLGREFDRVVIQAGYVNGPYGVIFDGQIKQTRRGKENQTDSYIDIFGADGDAAYNYGISAIALAAGATTKQKIDALAKAMGIDVGYVSNGLEVNPSAAARGQVQFGLAKDYARQLAIANNARWSIQGGKLVFISNSDYIEASPIILNATSGMIGIPEQTQSGISVQALINFNFVIGRPVNIAEADINPAAFPTFSVLRSPTKVIPNSSQDVSNPDNALTFDLASPLSASGLYRIAVAEFEGDTRGQPWYANLTCFAIAPDVAPGAAVNPWPGSTS